MRIYLFLLLVGGSLAIAGCGPGEGDIAGVVKYKGKPLTGGLISFYVDNKVSSAPLDETGAYTATKVQSGTAKIAVTTPTFTPLPGMPPAPQIIVIPDHYADREKSGLTYEVRSGTQTHDLNLD